MSPRAGAASPRRGSPPGSSIPSSLQMLRHPPPPPPPDPSFHSAPAQPEPSPCSASPWPRCCAAPAPAAGLCGTRRDPGARHRGGPGRDEVVAVPIWPRVCQRGGVNSSLCTVEIQRALGICMIKERAEAVWAPLFSFFLSRPACAQGRNALDAPCLCWEEPLKPLAPKPGCGQLRLRLKFNLMF